MIRPIPFLDLHAAYGELRQDIDAAVQRVLDSGYYILGPEVEAFESEFAKFCEAPHAIGVANGLDALILSLKALGIGPGHEVLVPSNTYIATWLAVSEVGAVPVPVEPCPETHNIDPARLNEALTSRSRAIIPVHLYGCPADLDPILDFARAHDLRVIEDAAQAQGARYKGRRIGAHGDVVCWSFYPGKNLGAFGDGGCITTGSDEIAENLRMLRNYGSQEKYVHEIKGMNSRLDPIQAAILRVKLGHLDAWNDRRRAIAAYYSDALADADVTLPSVPDFAEPVWHLYVIRHRERGQLQDALSAGQIGTLSHYPVAPHMQKAYRDLGLAPDALPIARQLASEVLSLPIGPHLAKSDAERIADVIRNFAGKRVAPTGVSR